MSEPLTLARETVKYACSAHERTLAEAVISLSDANKALTERDEARRLVDGIDEERRGALDLCVERNKEIAGLSAELAEARKALHEIADEAEVHTKLNQERLCCKFQDIASRALASKEASHDA